MIPELTEVSIEVLPKFPGNSEETYAKHAISIFMDHHRREKRAPCPLFVVIDFIQGGGKDLWSLLAKVLVQQFLLSRIRHA